MIFIIYLIIFDGFISFFQRIVIKYFYIIRLIIDYFIRIFWLNIIIVIDELISFIEIMIQQIMI
jgi:hypothetical protein